MTQKIRANSVLPARRESLTLSTADGLELIGEIALPEDREPAATLICLHPLPTRRPPCFFDPRHGLSVEDVPYAPPGGAVRDVPACALDAQRVRVGAEPDIRKVMVGNRSVPYFQGGRAYQPYAQGYFGNFGPMDWMFMGMLFSGGFDGLGEGIGALGEGVGDMFGGLGDGLGNLFDGFDF